MAQSYEYLLKQNPGLTGREIIALHDKEVEKDRLAEEKRLADKIALVNLINETPLYFKGQFGLRQFYYKKVYNAQLVSGEVICTVDSFIIFTKGEKGEVESIERKILEREKFQRHFVNGIENDPYMKKTSKEDWDTFAKYINGVLGINFFQIKK